MALIKCPECGNDVSDTAGRCPNCGYELKKGTSIRNKTMFANKKIIVVAVVCFCLALIIAFVLSHNKKRDNPFSLIKKGMTRGEVVKILGEPDIPDISYDKDDPKEIINDIYSNISLFGVSGLFHVEYDNSTQQVYMTFWESPEAENDINEYTEDILKIKQGIAKYCGDDSNYSGEQWVDKNGNMYHFSSSNSYFKQYTFSYYFKGDWEDVIFN